MSTNIILEAIVGKDDGWEVHESHAMKNGGVYSACIQMMVGYFRTGIYHRGYAIWEQDHAGKDILDLRDIVKDLHTEVIIANDDPKRYIDGVLDDIDDIEGYIIYDARE